MSLRSGGISVVLLALFGLIGFAVYRNFLPVSGWDYIAPTGDYAKDEYLPLQQFYQRLGHQTTRLKTLPELETALKKRQAQHSALWLLISRNETNLRSEEIQQLLAWVKKGGHLVLPANNNVFDDNDDDPLLRQLGVHSEEASTGKSDSDDEVFDGEADREDADHEAESSTPKRPKPSQCFMQQHGTLRGPGLSTPLPVRWANDYTLSARVKTVSWDDELGARVLHWRMGQGYITVIPCACPFMMYPNRYGRGYGEEALGEFGHAALAARLIDRVDPLAPVMMMDTVEDASLLTWLRIFAWPVLVGTALLLLLWLWRIMPRFGPRVPVLPPVRRSLADHLRASGRFAWRKRNLPFLLKPIRHTISDLLRRRYPHIARLSAAEQLIELHKLSGLPVDELQRAFSSQPDRAVHLYAVLLTLFRLRRRLVNLATPRASQSTS